MSAKPTKKIVVVGGEWAILQRSLMPKYLELGLEVIHHHSWDKTGHMSSFPKGTDGVVILRTVIGHMSSDQTAAAARRAGIPVVVVDHAVSKAMPFLIQAGLVEDTSRPPVVTAKEVCAVALCYIESVRCSGRTPSYDEVVEYVEKELGTNGETSEIYSTKNYHKDLAVTATLLTEAPVKTPDKAKDQPAVVSLDDVRDAVRLLLGDRPMLAFSGTFCEHVATYVKNAPDAVLANGWEAEAEKTKAEVLLSWRSLDVPKLAAMKRSMMPELVLQSTTELLAGVGPDALRMYHVRTDVDLKLKSVFGSSIGGTVVADAIRTLFAKRGLGGIVSDAPADEQVAAAPEAPKSHLPPVHTPTPPRPSLADQFMDMAAVLEKASEFDRRASELEESATAMQRQISALSDELKDALDGFRGAAGNQVSQAIEEALGPHRVLLQSAQLFKDQFAQAKDALRGVEEHVGRLMRRIEGAEKTIGDSNVVATRALDSADQVNRLKGRVRELEDRPNDCVGKATHTALVERVQALEQFVQEHDTQENQGLTADEIRRIVAEELASKKIILTLG